MLALKRVLVIWVHFGFQRFQRHVHTYRILPDADGLLAVQVSVRRHMTLNLTRKTRGKSNTIDTQRKHRNTDSQMESNKGVIKQWFVIACGKENRNMVVLPLCTGSVTTAVALLFEWHLCHVAACLQHRLSSTEKKLFLCLRDSYSTHTLGHWPMGVLICYVYVRGCLY